MAEYNDIELIVYAEHKTAFENMVQSGGVTNSQIGLIGDTGEVWINGAYYPFAIQGGGSTGNWALSFNVQSPQDDATKYTIQQGNAQLDILVPRITTDANGYLSLTPTTTTINLGNKDTEEVVSKLNISTKIVTIGNASSSNNGLVTANDVKTQLGNYQIKGTPSDLATDLTGVIEPTPQKIAYRTTAGNISIRDASAVIRRIRGGSCMWEQKISMPEDGGWSAYISNNLTLECSGNEIMAVVNDGVAVTNPYELGLLPGIPNGSVSGHKYLFVAMVKVSYLNNSLGNSFSFEHDWNTYSLNPTLSSTNTWTQVSRIWESPQNNLRLSAIRPPWAYTAAQGGEWFAVKDAMLFDLTLMFGKGNEPASLTEFKQYFPLNYYPNSSVEVTGMNVNAIKTVGFNNFNKSRAVNGIINSAGDIGTSATYYVDTFRILPNIAYYIKDVANGNNNISAVYLDKDMRVLNTVRVSANSANFNASGRITPPADAMYMRVCCHTDYLNSCCVNISHSSVHNGEFKEYEEHTLSLPDIHKYFPNGMHGVDGVYDELSSDGAIKRFGIVNLGDLTWTYSSKTTSFSATFDKHKPIGVGLCNNYIVANRRSETLLFHGEITMYNAGVITLSDTEFKSVSVEFLNKMANSYLVYELANEERMTLSAPIQLDYWVSDWGTEEAISSKMSMPFDADIVYAFNAEGRIRDNERNIEILEERVNSVPYIIKSYTAYDFTVGEGTIQADINQDDLQHGLLSKALRECRPIYLKIAPESEGFYGAVAMKFCYEEDLIYYEFFNPIDNNTYHGEINSIEVTYSTKE